MSDSLSAGAPQPAVAARMLGLSLLGLSGVGALLFGRQLVCERTLADQRARAAERALAHSESRQADARLAALDAELRAGAALDRAQQALSRCVVASEARATAQGARRLAEEAACTLLLEARSALAPLGRHAALERLARAALEQTEPEDAERGEEAALTPAALESRTQALTLLGESLLAQDRAEEAEEPLSQALDLARARAAAEPALAARQLALVDGLRLLARAQSERGRLAEALEVHAEALLLLRAAAQAQPTSAVALLTLGQALGESARLRLERGQLPVARAHAEEAARLLAALVERTPSEPPLPGPPLLSCLHAEALALGTLADVEVAAGRPDAALVDFERALARLLPLADAPGAEPRVRADLVDVRRRQGAVLLAAGRPEPAVDALREALSTAVGLASRDAERVDMQVRLAEVCVELCDALEANQEFEDALVGRHESAAVWSRVAALEPRRVDRRHQVLRALLALGDLEERHGTLEGALSTFRQGAALALALGEAAHLNAAYGSDLAQFHDRAAHVLLALGRRVEALETWRSGLLAIEPLAKKTPENAFWQADLARIWWRLGAALLADQLDRAEGVRALKRAQRILSALAESKRLPTYADGWDAAVRGALAAG